MSTPSLHTDITSTVSGLSDDQLLEQTGKLARLDHQIHVFVIDHLCEIEARRVYLRRGFSSLFDYVKRALGYSDAATWRRINAMKLCTRIEGVRERLWDGSLTLDAAAQLQAAFQRCDRFQRRDRERARGAGTGTGSAVRSNGSARPAPEPKPGPVLDVSAQKALVEQAAGKSTREVTKMLADVDPALAVPADRVRPLGEGRWELKAVIDADCHRGLEQLKGLLSHVDPHMTLGSSWGGWSTKASTATIRAVRRAVDAPAALPRVPTDLRRCRGRAPTGTPRRSRNGPPCSQTPRLRRRRRGQAHPSASLRRRSDSRSRGAPGVRPRARSGTRTAEPLRRRSGPTIPAVPALRHRRQSETRTVER